MEQPSHQQIKKDVNDLLQQGRPKKKNTRKEDLDWIYEEHEEHKRKNSKQYTWARYLQNTKSKNISDTEIEAQLKYKKDDKEYYNRLSLERINFQFPEYGVFPEETLQPSIFFFKFLAMKPDLYQENLERGKKMPEKLKLYVPDTIILNDSDINFWVYTDMDGYVNRIIESDLQVMDKFKSPEKDENELIAVSKIPIQGKDNRIEENRWDWLNWDEWGKCIFSKSGSQMEIQRYIKCRGPKAFVCRSVWRRDKPPYIYILTNKANYNDTIKNQNLKFVVNSKDTKSYFAFYSTSGKHWEETNYYMNNIVKFVEAHSDVLFDELVGDFVKDEAGIWWFINIKALKVANMSKFKDNGDQIALPYFDFFLNRRGNNKDYHRGVTRKFDYQTKIKCKFCGIDYSKAKLKYKWTTKMILETDKMLRHVDFKKNKFNCIDRPDLKHNDYSMIYLPFRVCENCYLWFETLNDIKNYQIEIANLFKNPVNGVNFGFGFYQKEPEDLKKVTLTKEEKQQLPKWEIKRVQTENSDSEGSEYSDVEDSVKEDDGNSRTNKANNLYRVLIMFNDLLWNEKVTIPEKELFLLFNFWGNTYKVPLKCMPYNKDWDYSMINFMKIFHIICTEPEGFMEYVDKNKHMGISLGYFDISEEENKQNAVRSLLQKQIIIEDPDVYDQKQKFVQFASVDLSLQGLKYGTKYRNMLNGWLFKKDEPHYVGKWRSVIRIHKVKEIKDLTKYNLHKHTNIYIPPVNFVVSEEWPDYWIELVERQKLRETLLNQIINVMTKYKIKYDKKRHKKEVFQALETWVSTYSSKSL